MPRSDNSYVTRINECRTLRPTSGSIIGHLHVTPSDIETMISTHYGTDNIGLTVRGSTAILHLFGHDITTEEELCLHVTLQ